MHASSFLWKSLRAAPRNPIVQTKNDELYRRFGLLLPMYLTLSMVPLSCFSQEGFFFCRSKNLFPTSAWPLQGLHQPVSRYRCRADCFSKLFLDDGDHVGAGDRPFCFGGQELSLLFCQASLNLAFLGSAFDVRNSVFHPQIHFFGPAAQKSSKKNKKRIWHFRKKFNY